MSTRTSSLKSHLPHNTAIDLPATARASLVTLLNQQLANLADLPPDSEIEPEWNAFMTSLARPATQARIKKLMEKGFHKPGDVETRLTYHTGQLGR